MDKRTSGFRQKKGKKVPLSSDAVWMERPSSYTESVVRSSTPHDSVVRPFSRTKRVTDTAESVTRSSPPRGSVAHRTLQIATVDYPLNAGSISRSSPAPSGSVAHQSSHTKRVTRSRGFVALSPVPRRSVVGKSSQIGTVNRPSSYAGSKPHSSASPVSLTHPSFQTKGITRTSPHTESVAHLATPRSVAHQFSQTKSVARTGGFVALSPVPRGSVVRKSSQAGTVYRPPSYAGSKPSSSALPLSVARLYAHTKKITHASSHAGSVARSPAPSGSITRQSSDEGTVGHPSYTGPVTHLSATPGSVTRPCPQTKKVTRTSPCDERVARLPAPGSLALQSSDGAVSQPSSCLGSQTRSSALTLLVDHPSSQTAKMAGKSSETGLWSATDHLFSQVRSDISVPSDSGLDTHHSFFVSVTPSVTHLGSVAHPSSQTGPVDRVSSRVGTVSRLFSEVKPSRCRSSKCNPAMSPPYTESFHNRHSEEDEPREVHPYRRATTQPRLLSEIKPVSYCSRCRSKTERSQTESYARSLSQRTSETHLWVQADAMRYGSEGSQKECRSSSCNPSYSKARSISPSEVLPSKSKKVTHFSEKTESRTISLPKSSTRRSKQATEKRSSSKDVLPGHSASHRRKKRSSASKKLLKQTRVCPPLKMLCEPAPNTKCKTYCPEKSGRSRGSAEAKPSTSMRPSSVSRSTRTGKSSAQQSTERRDNATQTPLPSERSVRKRSSKTGRMRKGTSGSGGARGRSVTRSTSTRSIYLSGRASSSKARPSKKRFSKSRRSKTAKTSTRPSAITNSNSSKIPFTLGGYMSLLSPSVDQSPRSSTQSVQDVSQRVLCSVKGYMSWPTVAESLSDHRARCTKPCKSVPRLSIIRDLMTSPSTIGSPSISVSASSGSHPTEFDDSLVNDYIPFRPTSVSPLYCQTMCAVSGTTEARTTTHSMPPSSILSRSTSVFVSDLRNPCASGMRCPTAVLPSTSGSSALPAQNISDSEPPSLPTRLPQLLPRSRNHTVSGSGSFHNDTYDSRRRRNRQHKDKVS